MMRYRHWSVAGVFLAASALGAHSGGQNPEQQATGGIASARMQLRSLSPDTEPGGMERPRQV